MNKSELIKIIASKADISNEAASRMLNALTETIIEANIKGDSVTLVGFGSFKVTSRAARVGRNPKTGEVVTVPAALSPKFSAGAAFKAALNNNI